MNLPWLDETRQWLGTALEAQRLGHAPLLMGPEGVGKRVLAEWLVRRILCLSPQAGEPCGECRSCQLISTGTHPDLFRVAIPDEKKEIPVDSVRDLSAGLQLTPSLGQRRVGWIEPAEAMNINAANALLKTLEEPPENAWLVLVSHRSDRLPATIRSRCQQIAVRPPPTDDARDWLARECPETDAQALEQALAMSDGAPLRARDLVLNNGLEFGLSVLDGMLAVARGAAATGIIDDQWTSEPAVTWRWIGLWTRRLMGEAQGVTPWQEVDGRQAPDGLDVRALAELWQQALDGAASSEGNARQDLLLGKWLLEWGRTSRLNRF